MDTGILVAIVTSGLALAGIIIKSWADSHAAKTRASVDYYHNLSGDAMARIAQLQEHINEIEADNEQLRCRVRDLEAKVAEMAAQFSLERINWQSEIHRLRHEKREMEARLPIGFGKPAESED